MGNRGRKSAAELGTQFTVIDVRRPPPPAELTEAEQSTWRDTVASMPAGWFSRAQYPLLIAYCRHTARAAFLAQQINAFKPDWLKVKGGVQRLDKLLAMAERETRAVTACARSMRLTQQSQMRATGAGTRMAHHHTGKMPWDP